MSGAASSPVEVLSEILTRENAALRKLDYPAAVELLPSKEAALASLSRQAKPPAMPPDIIRELSALAAENQILLQQAITVQTRIVRIVARACAPPPVNTGYGAQTGRGSAQRPAALALSTRA